MFQKILVLDDDIEITDLLSEFLTKHNYSVFAFNHPQTAIDKLRKKDTFDIMILDIMMPEMDGFQVLRQVREFSSLPIIMLSAKGDVADRVVGLELGADDYLPKPFEPRELLARIQSVLRRVKFSNSMVDIIKFDGLLVNKIKEEVVLDGVVVHLSTSEFEALLLFVDNNNEVLDREFLVENLRGIQWQTFDRSVDVLVSRLRNKLGETPNNTRFLKTIHGIGYKFVAKPIG